MDIAPHWTQYLAALLTPTVAVLGSFIAYRQWVLARNKLKLDLFDRRYRVYESARAMLASIMTTGKAKDDELWKYLAAVRESRWLLDVAVAEYLQKDLYSKALKLAQYDAELDGVPVGDERSRLVERKGEVREWLVAQYQVLDERFAPYLQLRH
jgi:hypothetical protein